MRNIILDTDIGNDVDDIFALIMLAKSREWRLNGVTTVYGDTREQGQMTRYVLDKLGRVDIPVFSGESEPIGGGPILRGPHIAGGFPHDLVNVRVHPHTTAVDFLIEQSILFENELEIIAIGPLTNIARAVEKDSGFPARIKNLTMMAGMIYPDNQPEWLEKIKRHNGEYNISCDLDASKIVFQTGLPITLIPLDVTTTVEFTKKHKAYFSRMPFGLGEILSRELEIWWNVISEIDDGTDCRSCPHDPMAVVSLYDESYFSFERGDISIGTSHGMTGMTLFENSETGRVKVAHTVEPGIIDEITRAIVK